MKKRPDLKQRLDELRQEPAPPVEVTLRLDAEQYRKLQALALEQNLSVAAFIVEMLDREITATDDETTG